jgi:hypothetical protein
MRDSGDNKGGEPLGEDDVEADPSAAELEVTGEFALFGGVAKAQRSFAA